MASHQATITAVVGPGRQATATLLPNITDLHFAFNDRRVQFFYDAGANFLSEFELTPTSVVTITNSGGNFSITIA